MYQHSSRRRPAGHMRFFAPGGKTTKEVDMIRCVHCQYHWAVEPGSGKQRGWCQHCFGPHCGAPACFTCVPFERKVEQARRSAEFARAAGLQT